MKREILMKINKFIIISFILLTSLFGCRNTSDNYFDIHEYKDNYLKEYVEILKKHDIILNYTVEVILIKEDSVTKGHGIILVVENKSYVLTNYHVIYAYQEDDTIEVKTNKKLTFQGNIIYKDPLYDLALLDFIEISNLDGIDVLNASDEINIESVYNPRLSNASPIVFSGLYKDKDNIKLSNTESNNVDVSFEVFIFQMDSQKGISGSPVFDLDLNLIGIVYAGNLQQGNLSRVYVIPLEKIIEFLLKSS